MTASPRGRLLTAALLSPLLAALAACGGSSSGATSGGETDGEESEAPVSAACPSNMSATAATQPPNDVPLPEGASKAYDYFPQGATKVWFFAIDGTADELVSLRDGYDSALSGQGYTIKDTDAEVGHEAESEFGGAHHGTTNFRVLCDGKVVFRLKLTS
jgi:hypothetical protein